MMIPHSGINFMEVGSDELYYHIPDINREECLKNVHLISNEGDIFKGGDVIKFLAQSHPQLEKLSWLLDTDAGSKAVDFFYTTIESIREKLKNTSDCGSCEDKLK